MLDITTFFYRDSSKGFEEAMAKRRDGYRVAFGPDDDKAGHWHVRILGRIGEPAAGASL